MAASATPANAPNEIHVKRLDLSRIPWLAVAAVVSATAAACWLRHPGSMLWIDPVVVAVLALSAVFGSIRRGRERLFWLGFALAGAVYALCAGGIGNVTWWFRDLGLSRWLQSMGTVGVVAINIVDASVTIVVAILGGMASYYVFPWARHVVVTALAQPGRLRFSLGTLLKIMALFAITLAVPLILVPLAVSCIIGALLGAAVSHVLAMEPATRRIHCTTCFGAVAGLLISPLQIAFAPGPRGRGDLWPAPGTLLVDLLYGLSIIVGCVFAGAAVGFLAWHALNIRFGQRDGCVG